jgi:hypothetical protein
MGDQALVAALRCEDEGALREFFLRFRPALVLASRRLRVDPGELDALVDDCLADVAVHLITSNMAPPRSKAPSPRAARTTRSGQAVPRLTRRRSLRPLRAWPTPWPPRL